MECLKKLRKFKKNEKNEPCFLCLLYISRFFLLLNLGLRIKEQQISITGIYEGSVYLPASGRRASRCYSSALMHIRNKMCSANGAIFQLMLLTAVSWKQRHQQLFVGKFVVRNTSWSQ